MSISNPDVSHGTDPNDLIGPRLNDEGDFYYNVSHSRESVTSEFKPGSLKDVATLDDDNRLLTTLSTPASPENLHPTTGVLLKQPERAPHVSTLTTEAKTSHKKWYITGGAALAAIAAVVAIGHKGSDDSTTPRGPIVKIVPGGANTPTQAAERPEPTDIPTITETRGEEAEGIHFPGGVTFKDGALEYVGKDALAQAYRMKHDIFDVTNEDNVFLVTNMIQPRLEYAVNEAIATPEMIEEATATMREQMFDPSNQDSQLADQLTKWAKNGSGELNLLQVTKFSIRNFQLGSDQSQEINTTYVFNHDGEKKGFSMTLHYKPNGSGEMVYVIVKDREVPPTLVQ